MPPTLCQFCSLVPHWLTSLSWDPKGAQSQFNYSYSDPTITLGSWRWMVAQAAVITAAASAEEKEWCGSGNGKGFGGGGDGGGEGGGGEGFGVGGLVGGDGHEDGGRGGDCTGKRGTRETWDTQEQGKRKGCHLCLQITRFTNRPSNRSQYGQYAVRPYYLPPVMDPRYDERYLDVPLVFGRNDEDEEGYGWEWTMGYLSNKELFVGEVVVVPEYWRPKFSSPMGYLDQTPETNIALLKDWLHNCRQNHTKCREIKKTMESPGTEFLPTRLIDVQAFGPSSSSHLSHDVRLVSLHPTPPHPSSSTDPKFPPPYLTLSHCWGPPSKRPPTTTTKSNLPQRLSRIPFSDLPQTFRDAIEVTRKLGYRYLWIDSLCIIQDDEQDWAYEAGLMASVYSHAVCTLSALSAGDSSAGFGLEKVVLGEDRSYLDLSISYGIDTSKHDAVRRDSGFYGVGTRGNESCGVEGKEGLSFPRFRMFYSLDSWDVVYNGKIQIGLCNDVSPLRSRAWTLQERELSRRVIHFAKHQVLWECAELKATAQRPWHHHGGYDPVVRDPEEEWWGEEWKMIRREVEDGLLCLPQDQVTSNHHDGNHSVQNVNTPTSTPTSSLESLLSTYKSESSWWSLIHDYSQRQLTKPTDKLAALSGIAQFYQHTHFPHAQYVAGLWSSSLNEDLLWEVADSAKINARRPDPRKKGGYVAPSWSWASVMGRVVFEPMNPVRRVRKLMGRSQDSQDGGCEDWIVEAINLHPKYLDPYGALLPDSNLIISNARLVAVTLFTETIKEPDPEHITDYIYHYGGLEIDVRWVANHSLDVKGETESKTQLWCWGMVSESLGFGKKKQVVRGLLLRKERDATGDFGFSDQEEEEGLGVYSRVGTFFDMKVELFYGVEPRRIKLI
ncbi:HET domain protein pin-c2 [Sordaria brevicollis]|uniref:HET domain protein pin-c2 n=1 Tax=Sordaria brevicollis TaxID=83679 RepID=A0AAE0P2S5_SORBR|nr:HET domain protein pin-c2 [Sordaria brevicollis]